MKLQKNYSFIVTAETSSNKGFIKFVRPARYNDSYDNLDKLSERI